MPADSVSRMDSNGASNTDNVVEQVIESMLGTSPGACSLRSRTDSEGSDSRGPRFVLPSVDGSPPQVLTFDEVTDAVKNIQKMELAHEIALNPEFKIEPYVPPENSLERRVRDMTHKAFWDLLREQLERKPPCYDQAIQLLMDIKETFPQIVSQNNIRVVDRINEVLDPVLIRQQAENNTLDFRMYAQYIVGLMAKLCAPVRDEAVRKLQEETTDVVETFRGILEVMTLMKLDMVNFFLDFSRNDILASSVEYERERFKAFKNMGFPHTEAWLMRNKVNAPSSPSGNEPSTSTALPRPTSNEQSLTAAYMELMDWDVSKEFPEMLSIDKERILKYCLRAKRLCTSAAVISIVSMFPIIRERPQYRSELAKEIAILLQDCQKDSDIAAAMENVWEQLKVKINGFFEKEDAVAMKPETASELKLQIMKIGSKESPVLELMRQRLKTFFRAVLIAKTHIPPPPAGFGDYKEDMEFFASGLKRVIVYNHSVFGEFFNEILDGKYKTSTGTPEGQQPTQ